MGCMKARLAGTPLQLGILCLAQNLLAPDVLLPDEDGSFSSSVLCENAKKCSLHLWEKEGTHPKCAAADGSLPSSSMDVQGLFPCFLEDGGRVFGVVMMFSVPSSGNLWESCEVLRRGAGKSPPSFTHSHVTDSCLQHFQVLSAH